MHTLLIAPRALLASWNQRTRLKKAQWIVQRLMGLMLLLGGLAFQHADLTTPALALIVSWFTLITFTTYIALMLMCGFALMLLDKLQVWHYVLLTFPVALYIAYATQATLILSLNLQGIVFLVILYVVLMVTYWGYE